LAESSWSNISDRAVEEIARRHVGYPVYLEGRRERPEERDTVLICYDGSRPIRPQIEKHLGLIPKEYRSKVRVKTKGEGAKPIDLSQEEDDAGIIRKIGEINGPFRREVKIKSVNQKGQVVYEIEVIRNVKCRQARTPGYGDTGSTKIPKDQQEFWPYLLTVWRQLRKEWDCRPDGTPDIFPKTSRPPLWTGRRGMLRNQDGVS
jgi:hypothetical protein